MKRREFSKLPLIALPLAAAGAAQAQGGPVEGRDFVRLNTAAPVTLPGPDKKVEVVEFFWYGCPHCFTFEPMLEAWAKRLPADVAFRQVPVGFMAQHQLHQRLFYALEDTGALPAVHRKVFEAIHRQQRRLGTEREITDFAAANGVDKAKFSAAFKSFSVSTKANRAKQLTDAYRIEGVPTIGVHGRFYTSASMTGGHDRALAVTDFLIQRARSA